MVIEEKKRRYMSTLKKVYAFKKYYEWCCLEKRDLSYRKPAIAAYQQALIGETTLGGQLNHDINAFLKKRTKATTTDDRNKYLRDLFNVIATSPVYKGYVYSNFELETRLKNILMQSFVNDAFHEAKNIYETLFDSIIKINCISTL